MDRPDLSRLPRIDALVEAGAALVARYGREAATGALREVVDRARDVIRSGGTVPTNEALLDAAAAELDARRPRPLRRVLNATGVVVHTNLGRAPLGEEAVAALVEAAGASDLEFDLATGRRGSRGARIDPLIAEACGAPDGLAVNNAAGALVLVLAALARGRGVAVSRGELVEIGGSFRIPDILEASGARLVEVGTTNRTRAADYAAALDEHDVALVLKVHPSNYRISGFTEQVSVEELAALARPHGVSLVFDVGSGLLEEPAEAWLRDEPSMRGALTNGADLAVCSGDKLLGGPQAGLVAGRADLVEACRRHPLARALRLDKLRIAALAATLDAHLRGAAAEAVPVWRMLRADPAELRARAERLAAAVSVQAGEQRLRAGTAGATGAPPGVDVEVVEAPAVVGGGAAPETTIPGPVVRVRVSGVEAVARALREGEPPVVARLAEDALWLDPRTIEPADDALLAERVAAALTAAPRTGSASPDPAVRGEAVTDPSEGGPTGA